MTYELHELARVYPEMDPGEYVTLKADIQAHGQLEAAVLYDGRVLDGRHRMRACDELGVKLATRELPAGADPVAYVHSANSARRHLTPGQRGMVSAKLSSYRHGGDRSKLSTDNLTLHEAAEQVQATRGSANKASAVLNANPELADAVLDGTVALESAYQARKKDPALVGRALDAVASDTVKRFDRELDKLERRERVAADREAAPAEDIFARAPLYDVWSFARADNDTRHPGQTAQQIVEGLLYLYTAPGDMVIDPFAGGGSTLDACLQYGRQVLASDLTPVRDDIREHDVTASLLAPAGGWGAVKLVYLDPPYGAQVRNRYSAKPNDLANIKHDVLGDRLALLVKRYLQVLPAGAHVALIIQATQWHSGVGARERYDHAFWLMRAVARQPVERIQCPYTSQQATPQQVNWAQENRRLLTLSRELLVWRA